MSNQQIHGPDADSLSALFDGELETDAAHFALKRLGHEPEWRVACGRWQLAGDVLRGNGLAPAPVGFADRVMAEVAREQAQSAFTGAAASRRRTRHHPRWIGGALAASVAIAALFVARPMFEREDPAIDAPVGREIVSTSSGATTPSVAVSSDYDNAPSDSAAGTPVEASDVAAGLAAASIAATSLRGSGRSSSRGLRVASQSINVQRASVAEIAAARGPSEQLPGGGPAEVTRPFMPDGSIVSKPWPRAAVPGYSAGAAMTVGIHADDHGAPPISFYPFEPASLRGESGRTVIDSIPVSPSLRSRSAEPETGAATRH